MNRTSGQREIEATCSKLHFHLLLCLFLGLKNTSCISASSNSKPSPGRVNSEGSFPRPLAELALASVATWKGIYSGTSKWRLEETAELDSEIDSIFISFIASVINVKLNNLAKRMCIYVCACAHSELGVVFISFWRYFDTSIYKLDLVLCPESHISTSSCLCSHARSCAKIIIPWILEPCNAITYWTILWKKLEVLFCICTYQV